MKRKPSVASWLADDESVSDAEKLDWLNTLAGNAPARKSVDASPDWLVGKLEQHAKQKRKRQDRMIQVRLVLTLLLGVSGVLAALIWQLAQ